MGALRVGGCWPGGALGSSLGGCRDPRFLQVEELALFRPNCVLLPWQQLGEKKEAAACGAARQE